MEDIPYAAVVDDANLSTTCSYCFMKGGKLLCCSACKFVYYCSKDCQRNDWPNHQHECKVLRKPPTSIRLLCRILTCHMSDPASFKEIENLQSSILNIDVSNRVLIYLCNVTNFYDIFDNTVFRPKLVQTRTNRNFCSNVYGSS
jgi:hypothetical protein